MNRRSLRLKPFIGKILLTFLGLFLGILALFFVLSLIFPDPYSSDPSYGWDNSDIKVTDDVTQCDGSIRKAELATFSNGFKRDIEPDPRKVRILILGDSFTEGYKVSNGEEYFSVIEQDERVQVFAKGVAGWSTLQEYLFLNETIDSIEPDIVIIQLCHNDYVAADHEWERHSELNVFRIRPYLEEGEVVYRDPRFPFKGGLTGTAGYRNFLMIANGLLKEVGFIEPMGDHILDEERFVRADKAMNETLLMIVRRAESHGNESTIVIGFNTDVGDGFLEAHAESAMENAGFEVITGIGDAVRENENKSCVYLDGYHWSYEGHKIAGDFLYKGLEPFIDKIYQNQYQD